jgi:hypothetical protein
MALGAPQQALEYIDEELPGFIEIYTWRELCREWLIAASGNGLMPPLEQVGGAWSQKFSVDVAGINRQEKRFVLGVCTWQDEPADRHILRDLIVRTSSFVPKHGQWEVDYVAFASHGWTAETEALVRDIERTGESGRNWHATTVRLLDLAQINQDLSQWSPPVIKMTTEDF